MERVAGKSVYKGIAVGKITVIKKEHNPIRWKKADNPEREVIRVNNACSEAKEQLRKLHQEALGRLEKSEADIFEAHGMLLEDAAYINEIHQIILTEGTLAEYAVAAAGTKISRIFERMTDEYMRNRAADIQDITKHLLNALNGEQESTVVLKEPSIIVAEELSPSEILRMDQEKILAVVCIHGSTHSHTAILARGMGIPTLVGTPLSLEHLEHGMDAIVDGFAGEIILNPTKEIKAWAKDKRNQEQEMRRCINEIESDTIHEKKISICANIGTPMEVDAVLKSGADGIGLFRSEMLYMGKAELPSEEEQFQAYRYVLQKMGAKNVVIRTLDAGVDKQAECILLPKEKNPALGLRGIRMSLTRPDLFKAQLRALLRAAVYGNLSILYPMIIATEEMVQIKALVKEVEQELKAAGISYKIPRQGIMIETPAAVMISDELAELADFFSIGTNDLTQYTLALDRQNETLEDFYDPYHNAIFKMIQMVTDEAHKVGKKVSICGELAADTTLTKRFLEMEIDELSVAPPLVPAVRKQVCEI